jgi:Zn-dependent protease with chaperone function
MSTLRRCLTAAALAGLVSSAGAQTPRADPAARYTAPEEAAIGREAAEVIRAHLAAVPDEQVTTYVRDLGRRLASAIPPALTLTAFDHEVYVVNDDDLTSVALPGGPVFISRGMIGRAACEGELAGLIAHELSHVALRHGTSQVAAGERYQLGAITGRIVGEAFSGHAAGIVDRGAQFAATTYFLAYDRVHERHANLLAAQLLARTGYDPLALGVMLQSIALDTAHGGARWARHHPMPDAGGTGISRALAAELTVEEAAAPAPPSPAFSLTQVRLRNLPRGRQNGVAPHPRTAPPRDLGHGVPDPAGHVELAAAGDLVRLSIPANWRRLPVGNTVVFAPEGAYRTLLDAPLEATHGLQVGVARSPTGNVEADLRRLMGAFARDNPHFTWTPAFSQIRIGDRAAVATAASNVSPVTGEFELVVVSAAHLPDGSLLYAVGVAPQNEAGIYRHVFARAVESIEILE